MKETQNIEWKASWRDAYLKWICGFANAEGGALVIGRDDRGEPVGVPDAARLIEEIPNKVRDLLGILVDVHLRRERGKDLVEIIVDPYPYPVSYKGEYHYRSGSTKQELKGAALDRFLLAKRGRHWDGVPAPSFGTADLESQTLERFRKLAERSGRMADDLLEEHDVVLLDKLHLLDDGRLKRAAVLLFGKDPERLVTGAYLKIGFFRTNSNLLYHDEIHGDLFTQVDRGLDLLLTKYLKAGISYEGPQRIETFPIPPAALREALINAVAHKDYSACIPIQISVYPDKLMIWNPGHLPEGWTLDQLTDKHASIPFNPDVANVFFRAAYLEAWGRGIELIQGACEDHGCPVPRLRWDNGLWVEFGFAKSWLEATHSVSEELTVEALGMPVETPELTVETPEMTVEIPDRIIDLLQANPRMTLAEVADAVDRSPRTVERAAAKLTREGRLRHVGPTKKGHWEVLK